MTIPAQSTRQQSKKFDIGRTTYGYTLRLAGAFRLMTWLILAAGVFVGVLFATDHDLSSAERMYLCLAAIGAAAINAAFVAFFGHVLEVLVGIYSQVWESRFPEDE